jgi:hypothetical protein
MSDPGSARTDGVAVSVPVLPSADVEYFGQKTIVLHVTNLSAELIVIDDITLQFQADTGSAPIYVEALCGFEIPGTEVGAISISVNPTARYLAMTNVFEVMVHYRKQIGGRLGSLVGEPHRGSHLIIKPPPVTLGDVFISFKQVEDVERARLLERYAKRAGLSPYLILGDPQPGTQQWNRIEEAVKRSRAGFIIWSKSTEWGTGVQREVQLYRNYHVREVLLLERHLTVPELFKDTVLDVEYSRFNADDPSQSFDAAVASVRRMLLDG